jgi:hypothetical protein
MINALTNNNQHSVEPRAGILRGNALLCPASSDIRKNKEDGSFVGCGLKLTAPFLNFIQVEWIKTFIIAGL